MAGLDTCDCVRFFLSVSSKSVCMHLNTLLCIQNEVTYLSKINHPNVVKLIGFCYEDEHRMLVYEYMNGGSLEDHLLNGKHNESKVGEKEYHNGEWSMFILKGIKFSLKNWVKQIFILSWYEQKKVRS